MSGTCIALAILMVALGSAEVASGRGDGGAESRAVEIGDSMRELIIADWTYRDSRFAEEHGGPDTELFSLAHTRDVVGRGYGLLKRLRSGTGTRQLESLAGTLGLLDMRLAKLEAGANPNEATRRAIHFEARWLVRDIAFSNPLLDSDNILFVERHDSKGGHMCAQYMGFNAKTGGGLFVLSDPFGADPKLTNILENSVVENGRYKGRMLTPGAFLSPDLSFDGETILFAYSEAKGAEREFSLRSSWHIFSVRPDGSELRQLTDGVRNDFDPCFLPSGRIVFMSDRRGGYMRCGSNHAVHTMFSMEPDGSDIVRLSFHESHEWHPSVNNDGMLVYTRWDYIDRGTNIAHHMWICNPDGRDPRSYHGNYPTKRLNARPWFEASLRAIPGSHKYVGTAAGHHRQAFGTLIMIDQRIEDDSAMSQVTRLTPEMPFPEGEDGEMAYGTPWPLSEDDYLCVYDEKVRNRGMYWLDRFGNKELLYRNPAVSSLSPIPLRPRTRPPIIPDRTTQTVRSRIAQNAPEDQPATVAVMNVYESDFEWPKDTRITGLRIIQVFPKSTPCDDEPRIGAGRQTDTRAILGTVPVEADGSAYFEAPAGKEIYFQALDSTGMAVQSMRSGTYLHPGEQLTCLGCHESKHSTPETRPTEPILAMRLAMRRAPSKIVPDVDGTNPINYVRLIQPVLERNCVGCHQEKKALDLTNVIEGRYGWTRSYENLSRKYGFYFSVAKKNLLDPIHGGSRTTAGKFGAKAAPLLEYLNETHYGVNLSEKDLHRMIVWLDANSEFYGAYENIMAQARGEIVYPTLE